MFVYSGYGDPFLFQRYSLYTVSILLRFLFVAEEGVVDRKAENLLNSVKRKLVFVASVAGKESPKRLIFAQ